MKYWRSCDVNALVNASTSNCQGTTCFLLQSCLRVLPALTSDTFSILWTLTASQFQRCFGVLPILSPFQQSTTHSFHSDPLPNTPSEGNLETSSDSTPSDPNSALMFFGDSPSHSRDRVTPAASDIKGQGWSGLVGNAGQWPWS